MKKVLVIGESSYIGRSFAAYGKNRLIVDTVSSRDNCWREAPLETYDSVLFCAGIAHRRQTAENRADYYEVNCNLAVQAAKAAKANGVHQFIYISSVSVFGRNTGTISADTEPAPRARDAYGESKLLAEQHLQQLTDETFLLAIIRPPMVYGFGCKGNFPRFVSLIARIPIFPKTKNRRSMIYIDTLSAFLAQCVEKEMVGIYHPQNAQYVNTSQLASAVAQALGKRLYLSNLLGLFVPLVSKIPAGQKVFGSLVIDESLACPCCVEPDLTFPETVLRSVNGPEEFDKGKNNGR